MDADSAPGPDGFPGLFYRTCWDIIANDLHAAVLEFFVGVPIPRAVSHALIVLLPKSDSPNIFADFRPISLCNFFNKIFTRILCMRLKPFLSGLISEEQTAFIPGRDISDNILLAQEVLQHLDKRVRGHNILFKLDMMKAFDRVRWGFLQSILLRFGFSDHFVRLILNNLSASYFSILVNGVPFGFFKSTRGLKQGDPLSPILFIFVVEAFSRSLKHHFGVNQIEHFSLPRGSPLISHLSFADDLIVFLRATSPSVSKLFSLLQLYELASGQLLNKHKSSFVASKHCSRSHLH